MRYLLPLLSMVMALSGCVSAAKNTDGTDATASSVKITLTAKGKSKLMPSTTASPGFSQLNVDVMTVDAVMGAAADITPGGVASLGHMNLAAAAPSCEVVGCAWNMSGLPISQNLQGLMSVVSDARTGTAVWHTSYATVINQNQIVDNSKLGGAVDAFAPAYVLAQSTLTELATLVGTDAATLVQRGVCLGLVWSTRGEGDGIGTGYSNARISVGSTGGSAPSLYYLNDTMDALSTTGTNQDGLFVLVGPDLTAAGAVVPASYAVPLTVQNATSAGVYVSPTAIVRPGIVTVVPIIPRR